MAPGRPERDKAEILSEKELNELRHNLAHLSIHAVRGFTIKRTGIAV
jgi:hypothetical protein